MAEATQNKIERLLDKFGQKRGKIDLSLGRLTAFLNFIDNPQLQLPPVIHFAGTNGKGSTLAFLKAMLESSGKICHAYTSPHLVRFNERVIISGKDISDGLLLEVLSLIDAAYEQHKHEIDLTFFELTTAAAFIAFAQNPADYLLLETGLGGRCDATNLIERPLLTIITPISFDHMEFLGTNLSAIAAEKAGIIKNHVPCISAAQTEEVSEILKKTAAEKQAELVFAEPLGFKKLALQGEYQKINAATATAAAKKLGLSEKAISQGLLSAKWPGRLQKLTKGPLVDLLPKGCELWLDGAHNPAGAHSLAKEISKKSTYLIAGMLKSKDAESYFAAFKNKVEEIYTIAIPHEKNSFAAETLAEIAKTAGLKAQAAASAKEAMKKIVAQEKTPALIFVTGSLYLAGYILRDHA